MGLYGQRTISYRDYKINEPIDKKIFTDLRKLTGLIHQQIVRRSGKPTDTFRSPNQKMEFILLLTVLKTYLLSKEA